MSGLSWIGRIAITAILTQMLPAHELPLLFEQRQSDFFQVHGAGYAVGLHAAGMELATLSGKAQLRWRNAAPAALLPTEEQATRVNLLIGNNPAGWRTGLRTFAGLTATGLYPGIDLRYHGKGRQMEYDFLLHPRAEAKRIRFALEAALQADGGLRLANGLRWERPIAWQEGRRIDARFVDHGGGEFGIAVGAYDRRKPLLIDPVLTYATYLGGSLADEIRGIAVDAQGNTYVTGSTQSVDFPGTNRGQTFGGQDLFVAKLNTSGRALVFATYIGGAGVDTATAIAVDATGATYVTGSTASTNFPVTANAPQARLAGGSAVTDAFVLKLDAAGANIIYATFLGGSSSDIANSIALDGANNAYVAGRTDSTDFLSTSRETLPARGAGDAFVTKVSADGSTFVYSVLLGGFALDQANGVAVDAAGFAYVTGETRSDNFPVSDNALQKLRRGNSDAFLAKINLAGTGLVYSTYYGGDSQEFARAIAIDRAGNAYITGQTNSAELPVSFNAAQRAPGLLPDAFAAKLDPTGSSLVYGTYLGGDAEEQGNAIAVDGNGAAYVAGQTNSANFPTVNDGPLQSVGNQGGFDGFLLRLNFGGAIINFSTQLGGRGNDVVEGLAIDGRGRTWLAGTTDSTGFPVTSGVLQATNAGATDGFVAQFSEISVGVTPATVTLGPRESQQFSASVSNTLNTAVRWSVFPEIGTISQTGLYVAPDAFTGSPTITLAAISLADGTKVGQAIITLVNRINISLAPAQVSLIPGQTQQFVATVLGTANTNVTWTLTPQIGTISAGGLYTAPSSILSVQTITLTAISVADSARTATATITLQLPPPPTAPAITAAGFTNAASFEPATAAGGLAAGEIITIFGTNLGPVTPATLQLDGRGFVANRLLGTRVLFDGTPGAMIATSAGQVSVVAPYELEGKSTVSVQVEFEGRLSNAVTFNVLEATPAIFTQNASGSGAASVIRQTGQLVTAENPAVEGEALTLYATGEGATTPAGIDGKPAAAPLPTPKLPVVVRIDSGSSPGPVRVDVMVQPLYAGGAPFLVAGVLQVNFVMPRVAAGSRTLLIQVGSKVSSLSVTIPVR